RSIPVGRGDVFTISGERQVADRGAYLPLAQLAARGGLPKFDRVLGTGGEKTLAVGTDRENGEPHRVGFESTSGGLSVGQIPDFDLSVHAAGDQEFLVRGEDEIADAFLMGR